VSSLSTRHIALLAKPTLRATVFPAAGTTSPRELAFDRIGLAKSNFASREDNATGKIVFVAYAFVSSSAMAAMSTTAPSVPYAVAGTRVALARTDGDPARRYTAMPAATSAITALP
jgi:hypothetical protein